MKSFLIAAAILLSSASFALADDKPFTIDMTAPIIVDGKPWIDSTTHDPADWDRSVNPVKDLDPDCKKCKPATLGSIVYLALISIKRDESSPDKMPMFEGWKAWADMIKADKAVALTASQAKLIEDRINAIIIVPGLATAVKKMVDPNYKVELPK